MTTSRLAIVPPPEFLRLVFEQRAIHQIVIRRIAPVTQRLTGIEQRRERLASLGTMAAGLAHELNNPAVRGARRPRAVAARRAARGGGRRPRLARPRRTARRSRDGGRAALGRGDAHDRRVSTELCESADRISALVGAVKSYAYMDRDGLVEVDLHEGLETTLTVLNHKLKHTAISVRRAYDRTLPKLTVHGSELNQVWTNLLDNAIGALGARGTITIRTSRDSDCAVVAFTGDGPGIPEDVRDRIFDPFFTTKDVGLGTGLGLSSALQIVTERHGGSLGVEFEPGRTTFTVRLPLPHP